MHSKYNGTLYYNQVSFLTPSPILFTPGGTYGPDELPPFVIVIFAMVQIKFNFSLNKETNIFPVQLTSTNVAVFCITVFLVKQKKNPVFCTCTYSNI